MLRWTRKGGEVAQMTIFEPTAVKEDWSIVNGFSSQNRLRHALAMLEGTVFCERMALPDLRDLRVTFDGELYRLWAYSRNWQGRGAFLAGILIGRDHGSERSKRTRSLQRPAGCS
jgi:hypothetical protein